MWFFFCSPNAVSTWVVDTSEWDILFCYTYEHRNSLQISQSINLILHVVFFASSTTPFSSYLWWSYFSSKAHLWHFRSQRAICRCCYREVGKKPVPVWNRDRRWHSPCVSSSFHLQILTICQNRLWLDCRMKTCKLKSFLCQNVIKFWRARNILKY